jgi:predicted nucleic acid-binding protein
VNNFVLDASYAITWVVEAEQTPAGMTVLEALGSDECEAIVPAIWADEVANVFLILERANRVSPESLAKWVGTFRSLPIRIQLPSLEDSLLEIRRLAQTQGLTVYDARYLHLAKQAGLHLATRDKQLTAAARKVGVKLVS